MDLDEVLTGVVARDGDRLLRVGFQLTHDRAAAQDLVQEALLRVYSTVRRVAVSRGTGTPTCAAR